MLSLFTPSEARGTASARLSRFVRTATFRLTVAYGLVSIAASGVLFAVIYWVASDALVTQAQTDVSAEVEELVGDYTPGRIDEIARAVDQRLAPAALNEFYYLLLDAAGRPLAGTIAPSRAQPGWLEIGPPDGDTVNQGHTIIGYGTRLPDGAFLAVGYDNFRISQAQSAMIQAFTWAIGASALLALVGGSAVSLRFLARIDGINRTTHAIMRGVLGDRVAAGGSDDELDELSGNLNSMLDRIQGLMESMRQVSSDIAHDLRTPLSRLRQRLEAVQRTVPTLASYEATVTQAIDDTDAILSTFAALLRIAEIESGASTRMFAPVDLSELCSLVGSAYSAVAEDRDQRLRIDAAQAETVWGDRELITQMLSNLVENAIRHSPAGTETTVRASTTNAITVLEVADNGRGIPEAERTRVLTRFYRLERSRSTPGNGLGLALVKSVCDLHRATLDLADNAPGLRAVVRFSAFVPPSASATEGSDSWLGALVGRGRRPHSAELGGRAANDRTRGARV